MLALKSNKKRLLALLLAAVLLVPTWPAARAETVIDPPTQGEPGAPSTPEEPGAPSTPEEPGAPSTPEEPSVPSTPEENPPVKEPGVPPTQEGGDGDGSAAPGDEVTTTPDTPEALPLTDPVPAALGAIAPPDDTLLSVQAAADTAPKITLESNLVVDGLGNFDGFVQLAIKVTTTAAEPMRSLSLSVQYSDLLSAVDWSTGGDVALGSANFATHIPAKHSDQVTGAAAFGGGTDRYLYIEAEAIEPVVLTNAIVAVVRFRYDINATPLLFENGKIVKVTNVGAGYDPADPTTAVTDPVGELFPLASDAIAATEPRARQAVWYESTHNNFYHVNGYDGSAGMQDTVPIFVNGVETNFAKPMTAGQTVLAVRADRDPTTGVPAEYYSYLSNLIPAGNLTRTQTSGPSFDQSGSGITLDDVRAVVALSWSDEFIGSAVVANGARPADIGKQVDGLTASLFERYDNTKHPSLEKGTALDVNTMYDASTNATQYPLSCHKGYNFAGWIIVDATTSSDEWTAYETADAAACLAKLATAKAISDAAAKGTVYLKAAYVGNVELNKQGALSQGFDAKWYNYKDYSYEIIGTVSANNGSYSIGLNANRLNIDGYGVTRLKKPALSITYNIGTEKIYLKASLLDEDNQYVEFVAPKGADGLFFSLVDESETGNFTLLLGKSDSIEILKQGTTSAGRGYMVEATLKYFYDASALQYSVCNAATPNVNATWNGNITYNIMVDMGLSDALNNMDAPTAGAPTNREKIARNLISIYMVGKGTSNLSIAQLSRAIQMTTGSKVTNATIFTGIRTHITNLKKFIAENEKQSFGSILTTAQITYSIVNNGAWANPDDAIAAFPNDLDA